MRRLRHDREQGRQARARRDDAHARRDDEDDVVVVGVVVEPVDPGLVRWRGLGERREREKRYGEKEDDCSLKVHETMTLAAFAGPDKCRGDAVTPAFVRAVSYLLVTRHSARPFQGRDQTALSNLPNARG
jgi:hypothetical protein